ncbi:transcription factor A, mitochondrial-like [Paramormyrops kingsleyae]|uniref:transcription factor A, mitochondrial-like n=1 Tax=Paramormyrops kingsleyae TaxID=1676925 RepID=UPI003B978832
MVSFSLMSVGASLLSKPLGFLTGVSVFRISAAIKSFSTTSDGPPKRPKTSYLHFVQQQWPVVSRQHPDVKIVDLSRKIAQQWRELTPEQKKPFEEASSVARKQYNAEMEQYKAQLSPSQVAALKEARRVKMAKRKAIRKRKELKSLGKPKRPKTGLFIFIAEKYPETKGATMLTKTKTLMEEWKKLNTTQKQVYLQQAEDEKIRYKNEMKAWEEHMREIGRVDLIRGSVGRVKKTASRQKPKMKSTVKTIRTKGTVRAAGAKTAATSAGSKTVRKGKAEE